MVPKMFKGFNIIRQSNKRCKVWMVKVFLTSICAEESIQALDSYILVQLSAI